MVTTIFSLLLLLLFSLFVIALVVAVAFAIGHYGLKLIDKTESWYKGADHDKSAK